MPLLLYRYILLELLRTIGLSTLVLVTVIAFGATIKPLAGGVLAPTDIAKYVILALVPMLQFALPFSAGFGTTMVLYRLVNDNELLAASVSGISYPKLLAPVAGLGAAITIVLVILVQSVIPQFWVLMQQTIARDAIRVLDASIRKKEAFRIGDLQIFAKRMVPPEQQSPTHTRVWLEGVAAAELDRSGSIVTDVTAALAVADFHRFNDQPYLRIMLVDAVAFDPKTNRLMQFEQFHTPRPIPLPHGFSDRPKYMSRAALHSLRDDPGQYHRVRDARLSVARELHRRDLWSGLGETLRSDREIRLSSGDGRLRYLIEADRLRGGVLTRSDGPVVVREFDAGRARRMISCEQVELELADIGPYAPVLTMVMLNAEVRDLSVEGLETRHPRLTLPGLQLPHPGDLGVYELGVDELRARALPLAESSAPVRRDLENLDETIRDLFDDISARLAQRYALATTGILLTVLGGVLAINFRHGQPLVIYLWAFLPAIADLLLISGGEQMMRSGSILGGLAVMWSGNILLLAMIGVAYFRLSRH